MVTRAALKERQYSAVMAATGLLYLAILTAFGTDLVARRPVLRPVGLHRVARTRRLVGCTDAMPRAIWSGSISFGLVNIPVKLYTAVCRKTVRSTRSTAAPAPRVKHKQVSAADGDEVADEDIVKGYELRPAQYVMVSDDELAALDPEASRTIDIEEFVDLADIDPIFYDAAYYLAPDKATAKPYALLARAMEEAGKVGIARFVMRTKQYLAAVRPKDGKLRAVDDGLRRRGQRPGRDPRARRGSTRSSCRDKELAMASSSSSR